MGMNPGRRDRYPFHNPTRWVFIMRDHVSERPWQGYAVDWKRHSYKWSVLVVYVDDTIDGDPLVQAWFPAERLRPASVDPNPREGLFGSYYGDEPNY